ncbi:molybdopterin synthase catalytic subunit/molybdopterin synthase sulfur carrier subunit [Lutibacter oceani]|uniref:Molybdopterin synthase sulfur carrier subunit n=1 Tax=Lutibacter oceani TaxID=1853311 RepID=A0A3D9RZM9_9FLAO|nr:MoaD/ThiS family protein [Lutibacter oceani]REE83331.1 molybdopterin synthase catalytic subunit/molybdopterin synthase sulfur carrier subunit [Lutibacter oceani]
MEIQLLFFGIATDLVGKNTMLYKIEENSTIIELKKSLISNFSGLKNINEFAIAVNEEYADDDLIITHRDVVAIIPPVSGG